LAAKEIVIAAVKKMKRLIGAIGGSMDVGNIPALATSMAQERTANAVAITVFKKSMDIQGAMAMALIEAVGQVQQNLPPHLGNNINTKA
jgi:hypothetical protein